MRGALNTQSPQLSCFSTLTTIKQVDDYKATCLFEQMIRNLILLSLLSFSVLSTGQHLATEHQQSLEDVVRQLAKDHTTTVNTKGDAAKHTPELHVASDRCRIVVNHEMDPTKPHWIQYVWAVDDTNNRILGVKSFDATQDKIARLSVPVMPGSSVRAFAYCNEHGLWKSDAVTIPGSGEDADEL